MGCAVAVGKARDTLVRIFVALERCNTLVVAGIGDRRALTSREVARLWGDAAVIAGIDTRARVRVTFERGITRVAAGIGDRRTLTCRGVARLGRNATVIAGIKTSTCVRVAFERRNTRVAAGIDNAWIVDHTLYIFGIVELRIGFTLLVKTACRVAQFRECAC